LLKLYLNIFWRITGGKAQKMFVQYSVIFPYGWKKSPNRDLYVGIVYTLAQ
jgi:hypothetical protein